jgi:CRP/FNR family transcriptional regulator, anaerobic regulatory protein
VALPRAEENCAVDAAQFTSHMEGRRRIRQGESVYQQNDGFKFLYVVHSGSFKSVLTLTDGYEQVSNFHMRGDLLGLDAVADGRHASSAVALEDSEVSMVPYHQLIETPEITSNLQLAMVRLISRELVHGRFQLFLLGSLTANQRLASFLLNYSERLSARGYSPVEFHLKMTRGDIGSFLGMTLETVSRTFAELHQLHLLVVKRRHIRIADFAGLARL